VDQEEIQVTRVFWQILRIYPRLSYRLYQNRDTLCFDWVFIATSEGFIIFFYQPQVCEEFMNAWLTWVHWIALSHQRELILHSFDTWRLEWLWILKSSRTFNSRSRNYSRKILFRWKNLSEDCMHVWMKSEMIDSRKFREIASISGLVLSKAIHGEHPRLFKQHSSNSKASVPSFNT